MANSESDSNKPKDDQAETPEDPEENSNAEESAVEETDDSSIDGEDADGESTEEHSSDDQNEEAEKSDSDDETVEASDDETDTDDDAVDTSDEDNDDSDDDAVDTSDEDHESETDDDPSDDEGEAESSDGRDGSTSGEEHDSSESGGRLEEDGDAASAEDDHDNAPDEFVDGDIVMTDRSVDDATGHENSTPGIAAFFDHPDDLMDAARRTRDSDYEQFDAFSPFPVHGMDEAMGLGRSWIPWVTFGAGLFGFLCAVVLEFGTMTFDWPMIIGGKPFAPWPSFVPVMFELTVLIGGVTTGVVMLKAAGCFQPAEVIDPDLTNDRFALWISADDAAYDRDDVVEFVRSMNPTEVRTFTEKADSDA